MASRARRCSARARGDNRDLDLLIAYELPDAVSAFDVFSIGPDLTDVLGIETQITQNTIRMKPRFRERIADDLLQVF